MNGRPLIRLRLPCHSQAFFPALSPRGRELLMRTPMRRFGRSEELIGAAVFLASDAASFTTGQSIVVDGGFLASGVNS